MVCSKIHNSINTSVTEIFCFRKFIVIYFYSVIVGHASSMYNPQEPKINAYSSATTTASLRGSIASTMSSLVGKKS